MQKIIFSFILVSIFLLPNLYAEENTTPPKADPAVLDLMMAKCRVAIEGIYQTGPSGAALGFKLSYIKGEGLDNQADDTTVYGKALREKVMAWSTGMAAGKILKYTTTSLGKSLKIPKVKERAGDGPVMQVAFGLDKNDNLLMRASGPWFEYVAEQSQVYGFGAGLIETAGRGWSDKEASGLKTTGGEAIVDVGRSREFVFVKDAAGECHLALQKVSLTHYRTSVGWYSIDASSCKSDPNKKDEYNLPMNIPDQLTMLRNRAKSDRDVIAAEKGKFWASRRADKAKIATAQAHLMGNGIIAGEAQLTSFTNFCKKNADDLAVSESILQTQREQAEVATAIPATRGVVPLAKPVFKGSGKRGR